MPARALLPLRPNDELSRACGRAIHRADSDERPPCTTSNGFASNPEAFDRGLTRRGLEPLAGKLLALDEKRRAAITKARAGAGAPQRGLEGDRRGQEERRTRRARTKLMAEVAELKTSHAGAGSGGEEARRRTRTTRWRRSPTCRSTTCRTARTSTAMSSITQFGDEARLRVHAQAAFRTGRSARA